MIILYIPFEQSNSGDLSKQAEIWKTNHCLNSSEKIRILYYQEEFNPNTIPIETTIYILAHGAETDPNILANHNSPAVATIIDIETLVSRFNQDLLIISHCFSDIHLYCCGNGSKNEILASKFQQVRIDQEHGQINFYNGTIYPPDICGKFWSKCRLGIVPAIPKVLKVNLPGDGDLEEEHQSIKRKTIEATQIGFIEKLHKYLTFGFQRRAQLKAEARETEFMLIDRSKHEHSKNSSKKPRLSKLARHKDSFRQRQRYEFFKLRRELWVDMIVENGQEQGLKQLVK